MAKFFMQRNAPVARSYSIKLFFVFWKSKIRSVAAVFALMLTAFALTVTPRAIGDPEGLPELSSEPGTTETPTILTAKKMNASASAADEGTIICVVVAHTPAKNPGGLFSAPLIAGMGSISCILSNPPGPIAMVSLTISAQLWLSNGLAGNIPVGAIQVGGNAGQSEAAAYSFGPCLVSGNYFMSTSALAVSPPGYFPVGGQVNTSVPVPILCP